MFFLAFISLFSVFFSNTITKPNPEEQAVTDFLDSLLDGYDGRIRPNFNREPVDVALSIHVLSLGSIAETTMDYKATIFLRQIWVDPRLSFTEFNSSVSLTPSFLKKLWVPDTYIINEKEANFHHITTENKLVRLFPNGEVLYSARITLTLSCPMQLHRFPMDQQTCVITMESYAYTTNDIQFKWKQPVPLDLDSQINLPQFLIKNHSVEVCTKYYATGAYPCLEARFYLSRLMGYYLIQTYVPSFLIVILSWVSFWISAEASPARVALGITTVLTMTTQSSGVLQSLPKVSYVKAIDLWMAVCLLFVFAALIEFAAVNYCSRKQKERKKKKKNRSTPGRKSEKFTERPGTELCEGYVNLSPIAAKEEMPIGCNGFSVVPAEADLTNNNSGLTSNRARVSEQTNDVTAAAKEDLTNLIDSFSRIAFPSTFLIFNGLYWFWFIIRHEYDF